MLIRRAQLDRIVRGEIGLAFRRWQRPTVKAGGTLKTAVGVLAIDAVDRVAMTSITAADARDAGFDDRASLLEELKSREGTVYRIALRYLEDDPRIALRERARISAAERAEIREKLDRYDRRSALGPWTDRVLSCLAKHPAVRAADLARDLGYEKAWFKNNVRKLKALGLTESLEVGYRLSPRGRAFLAK
jgi:hypothetical protein